MRYPGYRNGWHGARQNDETITLHDLERRIEGEGEEVRLPEE
jgi:hypothetical protein